MSYRADKLGDGRTDGRTDAGNDNTPRPKLASGKNAYCVNLSNAFASFVPPLCLPWPTNILHWAITAATTVPPFGDHDTSWATMEMVLHSPCLELELELFYLIQRI